MKMIFEAKQQTENKSIDIYIYDYVEGDSYNYWTGETIQSETSANFIKEILEKNADAEQINLYVNSYGGSVKEGLAIYNQLKRHSAHKTAYVDGYACSIASVIIMACDEIIMGVNTLMMIHHAEIGAYGNATDLRKVANDIENIDKASCSSYLEKAGEKLTAQQLTALLDEASWLNAQQCVDYGLADSIANVERKVDTITQRIDFAKQKEIYQLQQQRYKMFDASARAVPPVGAPAPTQPTKTPPEEKGAEQSSKCIDAVINGLSFLL